METQHAKIYEMQQKAVLRGKSAAKKTPTFRNKKDLNIQKETIEDSVNSRVKVK